MKETTLIKPRRKRVSRNKSDWKLIYIKHQSSGKSMSAFCRDNDLATSSYLKWKKYFDREGVEGRESSFNVLNPVTDSDHIKKPKKLEFSIGDDINLSLSF